MKPTHMPFPAAGGAYQHVDGALVRAAKTAAAPVTPPDAPEPTPAPRRGGKARKAPPPPPPTRAKRRR